MYIYIYPFIYIYGMCLQVWGNFPKMIIRLRPMSLPETITVCRQKVLHLSGIWYYASISSTVELGDKVK